jgi:hypothetical protein
MWTVGDHSTTWSWDHSTTWSHPTAETRDAAPVRRYVAVLGVYAFWGPQAGKALFFSDADDASDAADLAFGAVTVVTGGWCGGRPLGEGDRGPKTRRVQSASCTPPNALHARVSPPPSAPPPQPAPAPPGVLGSLAGGLLLDRLGSSLRNANRLCAAACLVGCVFSVLAFSSTTSFPAFQAVFAAGQLSLFMLQVISLTFGSLLVHFWCTFGHSSRTPSHAHARRAPCAVQAPVAVSGVHAPQSPPSLTHPSPTPNNMANNRRLWLRWACGRCRPTFGRWR